MTSKGIQATKDPVYKNSELGAELSDDELASVTGGLLPMFNAAVGAQVMGQ